MSRWWSPFRGFKKVKHKYKTKPGFRRAVRTMAAAQAGTGALVIGTAIKEGKFKEDWERSKEDVKKLKKRVKDAFSKKKEK